MKRKYGLASAAAFMIAVDPSVTSTIITLSRSLPCRAMVRRAPWELLPCK